MRILKAQLFLVINPSLKGKENAMASLKAEGGTWYWAGSLSLQGAEADQGSQSKPGSLSLPAYLGRDFRSSFEEFKEQPMCKPSFLTLSSTLLLGKLPDAVFSHTRVLWLSPQPPVTAGWEAGWGAVMRCILFCLQIAFRPVERGTSKCEVLLPHKEGHL